MKKFLASLIAVSLLVPSLALAADPPPASSVGQLPLDISQQSLNQAMANNQQAIQQLTETGQQVGCSSGGELGGALSGAVGAALQGLQGGIVNKLGSLGQGVIGQIAAKAGPFSGFVNKLGNVLLNKGLGYVNTALGGLVDKAVASLGGAVQSAVQGVVGGAAQAATQAATQLATNAAATAAEAALSIPVVVTGTVIQPDVAETKANTDRIKAEAIKTTLEAVRIRDGTELLVKKECVLDPTYKALANSLLARLTGAALQFVNDGCNGSACFVTVAKDFSKDVVRAALTRVEDEVLSGICSPQRQAVQVAVLTQYQFDTNIGRKAQCATDEAVAEKRTRGDFVGGGGLPGMYEALWDSAGGYYAGANAVSIANQVVAEELKYKFDDIDRNNGWLSKIQCLTDQDAQGLTGNPNATCAAGSSKVVIPGTLIRDQASAATDRANQELLNSHEIGELADSFFSSLESVIFSSIDGLFSLNKKNTNGGGSYLDNLVGQSQQTGGTLAQNTLATDIQGSVYVEQAYGDTLSLVVQDLNRAKTTYTQVAACYQPLVNGGNLTISSAMALEAVSHATTTIQSLINPQINDFNRQIKDSDDVAALLITIRDKAANASSITSITEATTQFNQLLNSGLVHNSTDLQYLENDLAAVGRALEQLLREGTGLLAVCKGP